MKLFKSSHGQAYIQASCHILMTLGNFGGINSCHGSKFWETNNCRAAGRNSPP